MSEDSKPAGPDRKPKIMRGKEKRGFDNAVDAWSQLIDVEKYKQDALELSPDEWTKKYSTYPPDAARIKSWEDEILVLRMRLGLAKPDQA